MGGVIVGDIFSGVIMGGVGWGDNFSGVIIACGGVDNLLPKDKGGVIAGDNFFALKIGGVGWEKYGWGDFASLTESVSRVSSTPKVRVENKCAAASDAQWEAERR